MNFNDLHVFVKYCLLIGSPEHMKFKFCHANIFQLDIKNHGNSVYILKSIVVLKFSYLVILVLVLSPSNQYKKV